MTLPELPVRLWPLTRGLDHMTALRACAEAWHESTERFWDFDSVIAMLARPVCQGFYAATGPKDEWLGVLLVDIGLFNADLLYIYVLPAARGKKVGRAMMEQLIEHLHEMPSLEALLLEVRPSNAVARHLYMGLGFLEVGSRRAYYSDGEDALVLRYDLAPLS